jgi:hypothetical protein
MFCDKCGNKLPDNAKFCDKCGNPQINPDTPGISSDREKAIELDSGTSNARRLWKFILIGIVGIIALIIIIAVVYSYTVLGAGFVVTQKSTDTLNGVSPSETTRIITTRTILQDDSWINATIDNDNMEVTIGDICTMTGFVSGTRGPITYSIYSYEDYVNKKDYSHPVITKSFSPSADGSYKLDLIIDPNIFPVGYYVITFKIPNGQTTKLQFLVDAKGADCPTICDKVYSSSQYKEGLQYDNKGVAVCYC